MNRRLSQLEGSVPHFYRVDTIYNMCVAINNAISAVNELNAEVRQLQAEIKELKKGGKEYSEYKEGEE